MIVEVDENVWQAMFDKYVLDEFFRDVRKAIRAEYIINAIFKPSIEE